MTREDFAEPVLAMLGVAAKAKGGGLARFLKGPHLAEENSLAVKRLWT